MLIPLYYVSDHITEHIADHDLAGGTLKGIVKGPSYWTSYPSLAPMVMMPVQLAEVELKDESYWTNTITANRLTGEQQSIYDWVTRGSRFLRIQPNLLVEGNTLVFHSEETFLQYNEKLDVLSFCYWPGYVKVEGFERIVSFHSNYEALIGIKDFKGAVGNGTTPSEWRNQYLRQQELKYLSPQAEVLVNFVKGGSQSR